MVVEADLQTTNVPLVEIDANEGFNCRGFIAPIDVVDLIRSIEELGLIEPVVLRIYDEAKRKATGKKYGLVAGFRRFKATQISGKETIRATIHPDLDEYKARVINLAENLKRRNLNMVQEAKAIEQLKYSGSSQDVIADELGVSKGWVRIRFLLLSLPADIQEVAASGLLTQTHINQLCSMKTDDERYAAIRMLKQKKDAGEKGIKLKKVHIKKTTKRVRATTEMFELQDKIAEAVGPCILTRLLGWTAGEVSDGDLYEDLNKYLEENYSASIDVSYQT